MAGAVELALPWLLEQLQGSYPPSQTSALNIVPALFRA